jgi:hypothetical protein
MVDMQAVRRRITALLVKQTIAEFCNNQQMLDEVKTEKVKIIAEVATNDSIIRARFNDLFQHH